jgi:small-conductance mechanosensitive channel
MRSYLVAMIQSLGLGIAHALPGLLMAVLIFLVARAAVRVLGLWFGAVERGRIRVRWLYPDTVQPTRRVVNTLLWLFALVVAYPYLPGSNTEAFKGASVLIGLMVTLGSSGLVNQYIAGLMLIYSRTLRVGDFVRIGEVEGTVVQVGMVATRVKTLWREEVSIPNALIVTQNVTDYTRTGDTEGVFTRTSVTIGYDAPWRQVEALLLQAAERTRGLRKEPKPRVIQEALDDFYVRYTLLVCLERQQSRPWTLDALHQHIQDLFNEYGVQIMSPNYMFDPAAPKVVARKDWYAAPARPAP